MAKSEGILKGTELVRGANPGGGRPGSSADDRMTYSSDLVDYLRRNGYTLTAGRLTVFCAEKFGFCWGVDKAVDIVEHAIESYPGKQIWILNQIIHNPAVNRDFLQRGAKFIKGVYADGGFDSVSEDDVAIIPAFSAEVEDIERLKAIGCTIIDTTCPWVLKPHIRTQRNVEAGFTTIIHATLGHDETNATCSLIRHEGGRFLVVKGIGETQIVCDFLEGKIDGVTLMAALAKGASTDFDPEKDLARVALINQTTMMASESREIGRMIEESVRRRDGETGLREAFRDFDTICNATQENQDAMVEMVETTNLDIIMVVGGYNSSNTKNLARIAYLRNVPTYHIEDASGLTRDCIRYQPVESREEAERKAWLPESGPLRVGFTAGASTPDTKLASVMDRVGELAGVDLVSARHTPE
jgi:4-hydroxy-3-methylbut-2-enyl diphosphate reductase